MTLHQVIKAIEGVAGAQPSVRTIVRNDIFKLSTAPDVRYGVFGWMQGTHTSSAESSVIRWAFTFYYVDRLTDTKSNQVEVQSVGVETLSNIMKALRENNIWATDFAFTVFNQRFADECAGVFTTVTFETTVGSLCPDKFAFPVDEGSFNISYSDSFDVAIVGDGKQIKLI